MTVKEVIDQIHDNELYFDIHEAKGHAIKEHAISKEALVPKFLSMHRPAPGNIKMATRFLSKENALYWIRRTVAENYQEIKNWIKKDVEAYIELSISSELITGEGIAFHTDWKNIFSVHSVVVVLHRDRNNLFYVKTAYPIAGFDDVDDILDAMEEYDS